MLGQDRVVAGLGVFVMELQLFLLLAIQQQLVAVPQEQLGILLIFRRVAHPHLMDLNLLVEEMVEQ